MSNLAPFHTEFSQFEVFVCTAVGCRGAGQAFSGSGGSKTRKCDHCRAKLTALPAGMRGGWRAMHGMYCCPRDGVHFACRGAAEGQEAECPRCEQPVSQYIIGPEQIRAAWCLQGAACMRAIECVATLYDEDFTDAYHKYAAHLERDLGDDVAGAVDGHHPLLCTNKVALGPAECSALVQYINRHFDTLRPGDIAQARALDCVARALQHIDAVGMAQPDPPRTCGFCHISWPAAHTTKRLCRSEGGACMHVFWCCNDCVADGRPDRNSACRRCYEAWANRPTTDRRPTPITLGNCIAANKAGVAPVVG